MGISKNDLRKIIKEEARRVLSSPIGKKNLVKEAIEIEDVSNAKLRRMVRELGLEKNAYTLFRNAPGIYTITIQHNSDFDIDLHEYPLTTMYVRRGQINLFFVAETTRR